MPPVRTVEGAVPASGWDAALASLRFQQFRWLFGSNQAFFFAMNGQFIVRSYLAYELTESALALGLINLVVALPMLIVSPFGGVIADRVERRRLIMACQVVLLVNEVVILGLIVAGALAFWHLVAVALLMGSIFPFMMPARQAIVANVIGRENLGNAMALQMAGMNLARVVAPVLAGFLIFLVDVELTYVVAIVLYGLALAAMTRVQRSQPVPSKRTIFGDMAEGFRYAWSDRPVRSLLLLGVIPMTLMMPFQTLLVVFSEEVWDTGALGLGILQGAAGVGGIVGSILVAWRGGNPNMRLMFSTLYLFSAGLVVFASSPWFIMGVVAVAFADVFIAMFQTLNNTAINLIIPDAVRGRVMSMMMMTFGLTPLGTLPVSIVAEFWGARVAVISASMVSAVIVVAFMLFARSLRQVDGRIAANEETALTPRVTAPGGYPPATPPRVAGEAPGGAR